MGQYTEQDFEEYVKLANRIWNSNNAEGSDDSKINARTQILIQSVMSELTHFMVLGWQEQQGGPQ